MESESFAVKEISLYDAKASKSHFGVTCRTYCENRKYRRSRCDYSGLCGKTQYDQKTKWKVSSRSTSWGGLITMRKINSVDFILAYRKNPERWYPLIDHADSIFPPKTEDGDHNIGWYASTIDGVRPFFVECWAMDGITMLTIYVSTKDFEGKTATELTEIFRRIGYLRITNNEYQPKAVIVTDDHQNTFYALNILVGDEDAVYIQGGNITGFDSLNFLNKKRHGQK